MLLTATHLRFRCLGLDAGTFLDALQSVPPEPAYRALYARPVRAILNKPLHDGPSQSKDLLSWYFSTLGSLLTFITSVLATRFLDQKKGLQATLTKKYTHAALRLKPSRKLPCCPTIACEFALRTADCDVPAPVGFILALQSGSRHGGSVHTICS